MIPLNLYPAATEELQAYLKQEPQGKHSEEARRLLARLAPTETASPSVATVTEPHPGP